MKDLGDASHILGMHIVQNREKKVLFLSQLEYIGKVLMHFNMEGGKVQSTLLPSFLKLSLNDCPKFKMQKGLIWQRCHIVLWQLAISCMQ